MRGSRTREDKGDDEEEEHTGRAHNEGKMRDAGRGRKRVRKEVDSKVVEKWRDGGDGEEAGGLPIADEIRSLLPLARTAGPGPSCRLRRSHDLEAHGSMLV